MQLLHSIRIPGMTAFVWGYARGGNGVAIGTPRGRQTIFHAYEIERGTPPPLPPENWQALRHTDSPAYVEAHRAGTNRLYWRPWNTSTMTREQILRPACGPLQSTSRIPRWVAQWPHTWGLPPIHCANCITATQGIEVQIHDTLVRNDPWRTIVADRTNQIDPVTGQ